MKTRRTATALISMVFLSALLCVSCIKVSIPIGLPEKPPRILPGSILLLEGYGEVVEANRGSGIGALLAGSKDTLLDIISALRKAAVDSRIQGVVIKLGDWSIGMAQAQDLREAISEFRRSGKPISAFARAYGNSDYLVAAACNQVFLAPAGMLMINGFSATASYLHKALQKIGVRVEAIRFERFKTAPETFTEEGMSAAQREQVGAYLDTVYEEFLEGIASDRHLEKAQLEKLVDNAPYDFESGLKAKGLIDDQKNLDEVIAAMAGIEGDASVVTLDEYRRVPEGKLGFRLSPAVAVVTVNGSIASGEDSFNPLSGGSVIGCDTLIAQLKSARQDPDIRAVVLRIDSPGGDGLASEAILHEVQRTRKAKPVVVSMGNVAASGGYYIAALADAIVAEPTTLTGSIGGFVIKPDLSELFSKIGINRETIKRGKNSDLSSLDRPWTAEEKEIFSRLISNFYRRFISLVAEGRKMPLPDVQKLAGGRIWSGKDAKARGLVDILGGLERAVEIAKEKAGIAREQSVRLILFPKRKNMIESLLNLGGRSNAAASTLSSLPLLPESASFLALLERTCRGGRMPILALMPYSIEVR